MSSLKIRLGKLESTMLTETELYRIAHFIVDPGDLDPIGYVCGDIKIIRENGENTEALHKRCSDSVEWPDGNCSHVFYPIVMPLINFVSPV